MKRVRLKVDVVTVCGRPLYTGSEWSVLAEFDDALGPKLQLGDEYGNEVCSAMPPELVEAIDDARLNVA